MSEIDVTICKYYSTKEYISNNNGYTEYPDYCSCYADGHCLEHPNCYYKQLQQLKVILDEIERMCKHEIKNLTDSCINGGRYFEIIELIKQVKEDEE